MLVFFDKNLRPPVFLLLLKLHNLNWLHTHSHVNSKQKHHELHRRSLRSKFERQTDSNKMYRFFLYLSHFNQYTMMEISLKDFCRQIYAWIEIEMVLIWLCCMVSTSELIICSICTDQSIDATASGRLFIASQLIASKLIKQIGLWPTQQKKSIRKVTTE